MQRWDRCLSSHFQCDLNLRHTGWVQCSLFDPAAKVIHLELKGPDNTLRLRQIKVLGTIDGTPSTPGGPGGANYLAMQQKNCEAETLKVFRLLTSQVFGRLISEDASSLDEADGQKEAANLADPESGDVDLKEHMVGILFSRSKLSHLQKQVGLVCRPLAMESALLESYAHVYCVPCLGVRPHRASHSEGDHSGAGRLGG